MTHYILQVVVFQMLFLVVYLFALKNETFFSYNRIYLLGSAMISFLLPFIQFDIINEQIPTLFRTELPAIFLGNAAPEANVLATALDPVIIAQDTLNLQAIIVGIYIIGVVVSVLFFLSKLQKVYEFQKQGSRITSEGYRVCTLPNSSQAFTFMKTIYLGDAISEVEKEHIIAHEKVHIDQKHTLDLLLFEGLKIACWFNPMVYLYQKELRTLHEFTADYTIAKKDKSQYYQNLLSQVFGTTSISFINTFFNQSLIKKRIIMLQKSKSNRVSVLKYLLIIPFIVGMLVYTSCTNEEADASATADLTAAGDTEVMQKINELADAIMKKGNLTDEEMKALEFLAAETEEGDKIYTSVQEYLDDPDGKRYKTVERNTDVPFAVLDKAPVFPGCENEMDNANSKKCFGNAIQKVVQENFNTKLGDNLGLTGRQRVLIQFKINKNGDIQDVLARAAHPSLEQEAMRVINLIPKVTPGMHDDKAVNVLYSLPILFEINE